MDHKQRFRKQDVNGKSIKTIQLRSSSLRKAFRVQKDCDYWKNTGGKEAKGREAMSRDYT